MPFSAKVTQIVTLMFDRKDLGPRFGVHFEYHVH